MMYLRCLSADAFSPPLVRFRPRPGTHYVSRGFLSLATDADGFISDGAEHGLFAYESRILSRYRYLVDGEPLAPLALSNVDEHTWLGHYIRAAPGYPPGAHSRGNYLHTVVLLI